VDLKAWNDKLTDRSERIVMETTGRDRAAARAALETAEGAVKTAIVMVKLDVGRAEAERLIDSHLGRLRELLGDPPDIRVE
jgi:N-acetylmuramic acid 6-phosphate etherase